MSDRLISDIDPIELSEAIVTALRDAGIDYCEYEDPFVMMDGTVDAEDLGSHLKRILMMDPPADADRITAAEKD